MDIMGRAVQRTGLGSTVLNLTKLGLGTAPVTGRGVKRGGFTTPRRTVTSSRGGQKGDLQIQNINLVSKTHLVIDVALVHDFSGDCWRESRNGQLRCAEQGGKRRNRRE